MSLAKEIRGYLLAQAAAGIHPTIREVATQFHCSFMTVSKARRQLINQGLLPEPPRSSRGPRTPRGVSREDALPDLVSLPGDGGEPKSLSGTNLVRDLIAGATSPALSLDEQRERLSYLAQNAAREEVQISALSALARLDALAGVRSGPSSGPILSDEEAIDHLSLLLKANGQSRAERAYALAFPASPAPR